MNQALVTTDEERLDQLLEQIKEEDDQSENSSADGSQIDSIDLQIVLQQIQTQATKNVESYLNSENELEIFTALTSVEFTQASHDSIDDLVD